MKQYLLTAGPTPVPEQVLLAMSQPMIFHRSPAFAEFFVLVFGAAVFLVDFDVVLFFVLVLRAAFFMALSDGRGFGGKELLTEGKGVPFVLRRSAGRRESLGDADSATSSWAEATRAR